MITTKRLFAVVILVLGTMLCFAEPELRSVDYQKLVNAVTLKFEDFPAVKNWNGKRCAPVLDTDFKKQYRTLIKQNAADEPNFNGIYRIAEFGAGTGWHGFFVINLETGIVTEGIFNEFGLEYSKDSRMLVVNPSATILDYWQDEEYIPARAFSSYLLFEDGQFIKLLDVYKAD